MQTQRLNPALKHALPPASSPYMHIISTYSHIDSQCPHTAGTMDICLAPSISRLKGKQHQPHTIICLAPDRLFPSPLTVTLPTLNILINKVTLQLHASNSIISPKTDRCGILLLSKLYSQLDLHQLVVCVVQVCAPVGSANTSLLRGST